MDQHFRQQTDFMKALETTIQSVRGGGQDAALLLLGLGRLDFIDRNLGFIGGDVVLRNVAGLIQGLAPECRMFRVRDARYALILDCNGPEDAMEFAHRLVALCSSPHAIDGFEVFSPPFIGVVMIDPDHDPTRLLKSALIAMDDARQSHLGCARMFEPERQSQADHRFHLENDMRAAFETDQFHVVYQPLVDLTSSASGAPPLLGFEALLRWKHPHFGPVSPDQFIPVSEECGLIKGLGQYVLWTACRQQVDWAAATGRQVFMSVNLSPVQLMAAGIEDAIAEAVNETGIDPHYLKLEVTETALATNPSLLVEKLKNLREIGVSVGVDDFGSGYSSLGQLDLFGLDFMKIDKSLIQRLGPSGRQTELVRLTIALARHLGMFVVAEGIEDVDHLDILTGLGVNVGQGYLFGRPQPPAQAALWLRHNDWALDP